MRMAVQTKCYHCLRQLCTKRTGLACRLWILLVVFTSWPPSEITFKSMNNGSSRMLSTFSWNESHTLFCKWIRHLDLLTETKNSNFFPHRSTLYKTDFCYLNRNQSEWWEVKTMFQYDWQSLTPSSELLKLFLWILRFKTPAQNNCNRENKKLKFHLQ